MNGEDLLENGITEALNEELPNRAVDPFTITMIINAIFEGIRGCQSVGAAERQIKRGRSLVKRKLYNTFLNNGYSTEEAKDMAKNLAKRGRDLSEEEVKEIIEDARDVPQEPWQSTPWPTWVMLITSFFLLTGVASASDPWPLVEPSHSYANVWPDDVPEVVNFPEKQIVAFMPEWCVKWCGKWKNEEQPRMEKKGWNVGAEDETAHIRIETEMDTQLAKDMGVTDKTPVPFFVMVENGIPVRSNSGYMNSFELYELWYDKPYVFPEEERKVVVSSTVPSGRYKGQLYTASYNLRQHCVHHGYDNRKLDGLTHQQLLYIHTYAHVEGRLYPLPEPSFRPMIRNTVVKQQAYCAGCRN